MEEGKSANLNIVRPNGGTDENAATPDLEMLFHEIKCDLIRLEGIRQNTERKIDQQRKLIFAETSSFPLDKLQRINIKDENTFKKSAQIKDGFVAVKAFYGIYDETCTKAVCEINEKMKNVEGILQREYGETFDTPVLDLNNAILSLKMTKTPIFFKSLQAVQIPIARLEEAKEEDYYLNADVISRMIMNFLHPQRPADYHFRFSLESQVPSVIKLLSDLKQQIGEMKCEPGQESVFERIKLLEASLAVLKLEKAKDSDMAKSKMDEYRQMFTKLSSQVAESQANLAEVKTSISSLQTDLVELKASCEKKQQPLADDYLTQLANVGATVTLQTESLHAIETLQNSVIKQGEKMKKHCCSLANTVASATLESFKRIDGTLGTLKLEVKRIGNVENKTEDTLEGFKLIDSTLGTLKLEVERIGNMGIKNEETLNKILGNLEWQMLASANTGNGLPI